MDIVLRKIAPFSIFMLLLLFGASSFAQGDLMVMPKRLVFDGSQRSQEINLINTGSDSATYAISFLQYNMTESGSFEEVSEPVEGQRFADGFLRYYPRRVVLGPNEAQTVRVQVTRTGNLEQGEYRSHIYFRSVEEQTALGEGDQVEEEEAISIQINAIFGISIPVIIRHGESTTDIEINEFSLEQTEEGPRLSMAINRSGNMSVYGDMTVEHISPSGVRNEVGKVKGIAVYTPNNKRYFSMNLTPETEDINLSQGTLQVTYSHESGTVYAKENYDLK